MSTGWSIFVILGTVLSLVACVWLLLANRRIPSDEGDTTGHVYDGIEELNSPLPMWWVGLFLGTIVYGVLYLLYYPGLGNFAGFGNWTSEAQWQEETARQEARFAPLYARIGAMSPAEMVQDRQAMQIGRRLYLNNCATCHGMAARGTFGFPNLTDGAWIWGGSFEQIHTSIASGRTAVMPPWGAALGDEGVTEVTEYVLQLAGRDVDAALATRGKARYDSLCFSCHMSDGRGNPDIGVPDLTNDVWLYGGTRAQIGFTVRHGRQGQMPAFESILGQDRTRILAGYVYSLSGHD